MNQFLKRIFIITTLSLIFFAVGITFVSAQGPDNAEPAPLLAPSDPLLPDSSESGIEPAAEPTPVFGVVSAVKVTPVDDGEGFMVKWRTATPTRGWIEYGISVDNLDLVADDIRGEEMADTVHWVLVKDVQPDAEYFFVIVADESAYDDSGMPFQMRTLALREGEIASEYTVESESVADPGAEPVPQMEMVEPDEGEAATEAITEPGAEPSAEPTPAPEAVYDMKVTPVEDGDGFMVKWKTATPVKGWIEYGTDADNLDQVAYDIRGEEVVDTTHWVLVQDVQPDMEHFFVVMADGQRYDNDGALFQMRMSALDRGKTVTNLASEPESVSAQELITATSTSIIEQTPPSSAPDRAGPEGSREDFIAYVAGPAQGEMRDSGVPASFSIGQSAHETGFNRFPPHRNFHGVKCPGPPPPARCENNWRAYNTPEEAFLDHGHWLTQNTRYANAFNFVDDPAQFAREVANAGYSEGDPVHYANVVIGYINQYSLTQYDNQNTPFVGVFYANRDLAGQPVWVHQTQDLNFDWGTGHPNSRLPADNFSVRWKARRQFSAGHYRFHTRTDDGVRLWVDGNLIINRWRDQGPTEWTGEIDLGTGYHWIRMEYYEHGGGAVARLWWEQINGGGCLEQSPHPYPNNYNHTWTLTNPDPNAASTRIHFRRLETERGWDYVYVRDGNNNQVNRFDGNYSSGVWSSAVPGRTVRVQLTTDGSVTRWGFCVDRIETVSRGQTSVTVQRVWTADRSDNTKTSFRPGDQIRYKARINNSGSSTVSAATVWEVTGPRAMTLYSGNLDFRPSTWDWRLDTTVPSDMPAGNYIFRVRVIYNGRTSEQSSAFTVSGGGGNCLAESPHPYPNNYNHTWTLTNPDPNAASTRIHFSRLETESGWDYIYIRDGNNNQIYRYSGHYSSGGWTGAVPGRTVKVQLTTDGSVTRWGFCVDRIETVSGAQYSATWHSQSGYPTVSQGGRADLWVKYRNTGNTTWHRGRPNRTLLGTLHPDTGAIDYHSPFVCSSWIGDNRPAVLEESSVGPGGIGTFRFPICAPSNMAPGTYRLRVAPLVEDITWMRQSNVFWNVTVRGNASCPNQYRAEYYNNRYLSGSPAFVQCEGWPINHNWGSGGPGHGVGNDNFSARWTGRANINSGNYTFIARTDDGIRVWIDNDRIIDAWRDQGATEYRTTRYISGGQHDIRVEYYEHGGLAVAQFRWEPASGGSGNLALNKASWATSQESGAYAPRYGNDGSMGTRWSSQISSSLGWQWFKVDLGSTQTFNRFVVRWEAAYAAHYWVAWCDNNCTSNSNSNWYGFERRLSSRQDDVIDFGSRTHRYVGVLMTERAPRMNNYSFWEFEVYNRAGASAAEVLGQAQQMPLSDVLAPDARPDTSP